MKKIYILIACIAIFAACNDDKKDKAHDSKNEATKHSKKLTSKLQFESSKKVANYYVGDSLKIRIKHANDVGFDSIQIYVNNVYAKTVKSLPIDFHSDSVIRTLGRLKVEARIFADSSSSISQQYYTFLSNIEPKVYSYDVLKTYPHDKNAFTQGLVFDNGFLYEATGLKGESSLRKVQLASGDVLQAITIDTKIFGEGITIFKNKVIQLSWTSQIGFVYDKKSFNQLGTFNYTTEGWGLTNDGKNLIMSDGTNKLYFLDSETYTEVKRLEVFDNTKAVDQLNELEYINGDIYANVYQTDKIAIIDAESGKVKAYIDLANILDTKYYTPETGVLNGIAYDFENKRLFVTGKKWTKLFEIKLK